jgi:tripartite-type tricarboxylate transporter receptor subunit TctC
MGGYTLHSSQLFALSLVIAAVGATPARADPVREFYRGKTVSMLIGVGVGGEYDLQARLVATSASTFPGTRPWCRRT